MMKPLTRDIVLTLILKISLLILLWAVCFKNADKPQQSTEQWLLGSATQLQKQ